MLKDPLTQWDGVFPYDALAAVGITPMSNMKEIMDASFDLMEQGLMTPEVRQAWDELRIVQRRLLIDFFLYPVDLPAEIARISAVLELAPIDWTETADLSPFLSLDPRELQRMEQDFRDLPLEPVEIRFLPDFDGELPLPNADMIEFDI